MAELVNISQPKLLDKVPQSLFQSVSYTQQREGGIAMDEWFSATLKVLRGDGPWWLQSPRGYGVHCHEIISIMCICVSCEP